MTSDELRVISESEKYRELKSKQTKLKSYINLDQILKRVNNKDILVDSIEEDVFIHILEDFYKFQTSKAEQNPEFVEIKSKIETFLLILKNKHSFDIKNIVSREDLERIDDIKIKKERTNEIKDKNKDRIWIFNYAVKVINNDKTENDLNFKSEKDKKYFSCLMNLYNKIINIDLENIDLTDLNNELRNVYYDFINKYYLINVDSLFADINDLFYILGGKKEILDKFIVIEEQRKKEKLEKDLAKQEQKRLNKKGVKKAEKAKRSHSADLSKYGNFYGFGEE